jgi:hypothetical protein
MDTPWSKALEQGPRIGSSPGSDYYMLALETYHHG